jgi:hypothetical protein
LHRHLSFSKPEEELTTPCGGMEVLRAATHSRMQVAIKVSF